MFLYGYPALYYFILLYAIRQDIIALLVYNLCGDYMKPLKEKISITIDNDILAQLRYLAEADDRSLSQYINLILRDYIRTNGKNSDENNELQGE